MALNFDSPGKTALTMFKWIIADPTNGTPISMPKNKGVRVIGFPPDSNLKRSPMIFINQPGILKIVASDSTMRSASRVTSIDKGSEVIVRQLKPDQTAIDERSGYLVKIAGQVMIRKLKDNGDGTITVSCYNPAFKPIVVPADQVELIAIVVGVWRECPYGRMAA